MSEKLKIEQQPNITGDAFCRHETLVGLPFYDDGLITLYCGNAEDYIGSFSPSIIITDPPYPNKQNHFIDGIEAAIKVIENEDCLHWMIFWDEMSKPPSKLPLVAKHIWHRNNSNRPDNYEMIYEYMVDGVKRASRVLPYPVIYPGLTGCKEATGHPTQKNYKLMMKLISISRTNGLIYDPFAGSGTTLIAARKLRRKAVGIEKDEHWCNVIVDRLNQMEMSL